MEGIWFQFNYKRSSGTEIRVEQGRGSVFNYMRLCIVISFFTVVAFSTPPSNTVSFEHFITRSGDTLYDGNDVFRFISFNVPNLHLLEDDFTFTATDHWSLPPSFAIHDALRCVQQAGGTVVRIYCLRLQKRGQPAIGPKHLTGWRTYCEPTFSVMDTVIALAHQYHIRVIIPLLEGPPWWGSKKTFARLREGKHRFESREIRDDYKHLVGYLLNRRNTVSGTPYKDDKAILCWETGNEMHTSAGWLTEMAAYFKEVDSNHLVMDGNYGVRTAALDDPNVDIVSNHFYKKGADGITRDLKKVAGRKAYIVGEWGWSPEKTREVIRRVVASPAAGALAWSLRPRYRSGGFTWHRGEGLHWPGGFAREERDGEKEILAAVRKGAFTIRNLQPPPPVPPAAPVMLPVMHPSAISWQGSAGATRYTVEKSSAPEGPWMSVGDSIDETVVAFRPLFSDTTTGIGDTCYYRVIAYGPGGKSRPSEPAGPVVADHLTLVDELLPGSEKYSITNGTEFTDARPWRFKYDFHRRGGDRGDFVEYAVDGRITGMRVYAFFPGKRSDFQFRFRNDSAEWLANLPEVTEYPYCCTEFRDQLRLPVLFTVEAPSVDCNHVRISFPGGKAEIGRCEVDFVKYY